MNKKKLIIIIIAIITVLIIGIVLFSRYKRKKALSTLTAVTTKTSTGTNTTPKTNSSVFPLKTGSQGEEVMNLQKYLNYFQGIKYPTYPKINLNGSFGSDTQRVLKLILNIDTMSQSLYNTTVYPWILNYK